MDNLMDNFVLCFGIVFIVIAITAVFGIIKSGLPEESGD